MNEFGKLLRKKSKDLSMIRAALEKQTGLRFEVEFEQTEDGLTAKFKRVKKETKFPIGVAARNIKIGEIIQYDPCRDTEDIIIKTR